MLWKQGTLPIFHVALVVFLGRPALRGRTIRPNIDSRRFRNVALPNGQPVEVCRRNAATAASSSSPRCHTGQSSTGSDSVGMSEQPRLASEAAMRRRARPWIFFGLLCHTRTHRIALDVAHRTLQMRLLQPAREGSSLPQTPGKAMCPVHVLRVPQMERFQHSGQRMFCDMGLCFLG